MFVSTKKRIPFGPLFQGLIADPQAKHYHRMKSSVWLYLYLIAFSNLRSGKLIARLTDIARDMGLTEDTLRSWLGHLRRWHYVDVEKQGDALLFKIVKWQNIAAEIEKFMPAATTRPETTRRKSVGKTTRTALSAQQLPLNDNSAQLASYIVKLLNEPTSQAAIETVCRRYPRHVIYQALSQTRAVPADRIKKSRGALFVYLVRKYAPKEQSPAGH